MKLSNYSVALLTVLAGAGCDSNRSTQLSSAQQSEVVESLCDLVRSKYVVTEKRDSVATNLGSNFDQGSYSEINEHDEFADALNRDLRELSGDLHFMVFHTGTPPKQSAKVVAAAKLSNTEPKLDMLEGNIAYLHEVRKLSTKHRAALTRLMQSAVKADAMIIDLRECVGGDREVVRLICSYFLDGSLRLVTEDELGSDPRDVYTLKNVPGDSRSRNNLFILVGSKTASGGEALAYLLKHHGRAVIVGDKTTGAAHAVKTYDLPHKYRVFIPFARPIHPRTGTNWEGKGVEPDVSVPEEDALKEAQRRLARRETFTFE